MTLTVNSIQPATGTEMNLGGSTKLHHEGMIIQTVYVRTDTRGTYASNNSGDGTAITPLRLTITPQRADSVIWLRWTVFYELHHDTVFLVQRNGSLIGYNTARGNARFSGILTPHYDNDYGSTPQTSTINWFDKPGTTGSVYYDLATRSAGGSNFTFALNRPVGSTGQDDHEAGISYGFAREICG
jgi:hypothetical protein